MYECAVVEDVGRRYITACYSAEGDSPLILAANMIFCKPEDSINREEFIKKQNAVMTKVV